MGKISFLMILLLSGAFAFADSKPSSETRAAEKEREFAVPVPQSEIKLEPLRFVPPPPHRIFLFGFVVRSRQFHARQLQWPAIPIRKKRCSNSCDHSHATFCRLGQRDYGGLQTWSFVLEHVSHHGSFCRTPSLLGKLHRKQLICLWRKWVLRLLGNICCLGALNQI